ncbi:MAG: DegT/DnrJ/EryC1/StrS family aminotransferase [Pseudonocardiaceae bacterium]
MIPLFKVPMSERVPAAVGAVLTSGQVGQGSKVEEFEAALRERIGCRYVATVNSATAGLQLALRIAGESPQGTPRGIDGEVLSTPLTMEATNWAILAGGSRIRWVDVDPATLNVDLDDLARKISPATRAIMIVHFAGYPVDLPRLTAILDQAEGTFGFRPPVIEDCAHAWGATLDGVPLGNHGNIAVFSFQAVKHLTCGDGGVMVLPNREWHHRAKLLRWFGIDRAADRLVTAPDVMEWGLKFHMTDINAAIGLANLEQADAVLRRHRENAAFYDRRLATVPGLEQTERLPGRESSFWVYPLLVENREAFMKHMRDAGITVSQVHPRNDRHSCVREFVSLLPGMDRVDERLVCIPVGWWVSDEDRQFVVDTIRAGW